MEKEEKINQLDLANIPDNTSLDYIDGDIGILYDLKELPYVDPCKLNFVVILICTKGKLQGEINSKLHTLHPNDVLFCRPYAILNNCMVSPDFEAKALCLSTRILQKFVHSGKDMLDKAFYINERPVWHISEEVAHLFDQFCELVRIRMQMPDRPYYKEVMTSLVHAAIYELLADIDPMVTSSNNELMKQGDILFKNFFKLLSESEVKQRSVFYYGEQLCVTPKYLSAVCKKISGKTASEWINNFVVADIEYLLKNSEKSIKEISEYLEFPNLSFFGKYVKAHLGVSPKEYRKQVGNKEGK